MGELSSVFWGVLASPEGSTGLPGSHTAPWGELWAQSFH